jgi:hypothetical protein
MHGLINIKSPNNTSNRQMGFNSAFKWLMRERRKFHTLQNRQNYIYVYFNIYIFIVSKLEGKLFCTEV